MLIILMLKRKIYFIIIELDYTVDIINVLVWKFLEQQKRFFFMCGILK